MNRILIIICAWLAGCSSVKVSFDYDKTVNFAQFKSYAYTEEALNLGVQDPDRRRIISAVDKEMAAKGFSKSESPDMLIDLVVKFKEGTTATATNLGTGTNAYRYPYGAGYTTQVTVDNYVVGTLLINMIDKGKGQLIWQGRGSKTLAEEAKPQKKEENISYAIARIFKNYPPVRK